MTFKKSNQASFIAIAFGLIFALLLCTCAVDRSLAQQGAAAPATAAQSAPPPCAGNADPKLAGLENCAPSQGDTAWMLTSVALVLMMTLPGLGLFYGGMVRKKNVGDAVNTSFTITCLVTILLLLCTHT